MLLGGDYFVFVLWYLVSSTYYALCEKCPNTEFFMDTNFPAFGLNMEIYGVNIRIQFKCRKIRTRKNSVFEHFSCSDGVSSIVPKIGHFLAEGLQTGRN